MIEYMMELCWTYFYVISEVVRLILRRRSPEPESGGSIKIGLNSYKYYVCINWSGLSALSGELYSLLRCAGGVGEAGASYMNKLSNRTKELFLLFPSPDIRYISILSIQFIWVEKCELIQFNSIHELKCCFLSKSAFGPWSPCRHTAFRFCVTWCHIIWRV